MAATNWTIIMRNKNSEKVSLHNLDSKWTYKTALGIAKEAIVDEMHEIICIVETNKILLKDEKETEKTE